MAFKVLPPSWAVKRYRELTGPRVVTNGCFDLLHRGHLDLLNKARELGGSLTVLVNTDESVRRAKGQTRPVIPLDDRMAMLAGLACVDLVTWFDEDTPLDLLAELKPDILVKGSDWNGKIVGAEYAGQVVTLNRAGESTTALIERIRNG